MSGIDKKPILSICIPTWNRAKYLALSLESFIEQLSEVDNSELELYVSDNCSDDDTPRVVEDYIIKGLPITYNRNETNLGAAGNFIRCMNWASGKYILLLGDDDILKPGSVKLILDLLRGNDYGLVHVHYFKELSDGCIIYNNLDDFLKQVSYWITFMSGSIFRKEIVETIEYQKYLGTHLLQVPFYLASARIGKENLLLNQDIIETGLDYSSNGGYNYYEVFVKNYLNIWKEQLDKNYISLECYDYIKKDIYEKYIVKQNYQLLIRHKNIMDESTSYIGNRKGYKISGAKEILKEYYGKEWYYKMSWLTYLKMTFDAIITKLSKRIGK